MYRVYRQKYKRNRWRLRPCRHVSIFVWKRTFFSPFSKIFASTRSVFRSVLPVHTKTLKMQTLLSFMRIYHVILSLRFMRAVWICRSRENRFKGIRLTRLFVLKVTIQYKVPEAKNGDLDLFVVQYPSPEEIISTIALHVLLSS